MPESTVSNVINKAASATMRNAIRVKGYNTYTISTNFITWDESNSYHLKDIAPTFGNVLNTSATSSLDERMQLVCGNDAICVYDYGLLYSIFYAMIMAEIELGPSFHATADDTTVSGINALWLGNDLIVYSCSRGIVVPVRNADVKNICSKLRVNCENFTDSRVFSLNRENNFIMIETQDKELLCTVHIPKHVKKAYSTYFGEEDETSVSMRLLVDDPRTPWDETSGLGKLISSAIGRSTAKDVVKKYIDQPILEKVVVREDLIFTPTQRFKDSSNFRGSLCYTDRNTIELAVNFHNGLFVYKPWFAGDIEEVEVQVSHNPDLSKFFLISEECKTITRYASTVVNKPLTDAQLDYNVYEKIKEAFFTLQTPRIALHSAFGKVVIPEPILLKVLENYSCDFLYCLVLVGVIGSNVITKTHEGKLISHEPKEWNTNSYFYDITEVIL